MKVTLSPRAEKQLKGLSKIDQIVVAKKIRVIREAERVTGEEKLKGFKSIYRARVGDFRILYKKTKRDLYIILIGHRKDVYRLVKRLLK